MLSVPLPPPPADEDGVDEFDEEAEVLRIVLFLLIHGSLCFLFVIVLCYVQLPEEEMGVEGMAHITRKMSGLLKPLLAPHITKNP
jgi:hypothetical protein